MQHIRVLIPFILGDPRFGIIFLGILNLAYQYLNLKPTLYFKFVLWNKKSIIMKITTSHSMLKRILKDTSFYHVLFLLWSVQ